MVFTILTDKGRLFLSDDKPLSKSLSHIQSLGKNQWFHLAQTDGSAYDELQELLSGSLDTLPYSLQNEPSSPQPSHTEEGYWEVALHYFLKTDFELFQSSLFPFPRPAIRVVKALLSEEVQ